MKFITKKLLSVTSSLLIAAQHCMFSLPVGAVDSPCGSETYAQQIGLELTSTEAENALSELLRINDSDIAVELSDNNSVRQINGKLSEKTIDNGDDAREVIADTAELLGIKNADSEIGFEKVTESEYNNIYVFKQYYKGLEMLNSYITVIVSKKTGKAKFLNSSYVSDISIDITPTITAEQALDAATAEYGDVDSSSQKLAVYSDDNEKFRLVWAVETDILGTDAVYVDALSGAVIKENRIKYDETPLKGHTITKNSILLSDVNRVVPDDSFKIDIAMEDNKYKLHDIERNIYIIIDNRYHSYDTVSHYMGDNRYPAYSTDDSTFISNEDEEAGVAVLYNFERVYDFFKDTLGYCGYDGNNKAMYIAPNFMDRNGARLENAVYQPCYEGAQLVFGGGDGTNTRSFGSDIDTVAHEYSHAIFDYKLNWNPSRKETYSLDEALADIMGEYADTTREWIHGTDRVLTGEGSPAYNKLRDFSKPAYYSKEEIERDPANEDEKKTKPYTDGNSLRHAAYWMDQLNIDPTTAAKIWFRAVDYLPMGSNNAKFIDMRNAMISAVDDVVDPRGKEMTIKWIKTAFNKVHIYDINELPGDLCHDGYLDSFDLTLMRRFLTGRKAFCTSELAQADLNYDGEVTSADLVILQDYLLGRRKDFDLLIQ